jgi:hypothetical protein
VYLSTRTSVDVDGTKGWVSEVAIGIAKQACQDHEKGPPVRRPVALSLSGEAADQAAAGVARRRRAIAPTRPKPVISIAQLAGSGTMAAEAG